MEMDNSFEASDSVDVDVGFAYEMYGSSNNQELDHLTQLQVKKLSEVFEGCVKKDEPQMKVYLRIRPIHNNIKCEMSGSTIHVNSSTTITTVAPDVSKRAQYTKTEERNYNFTRVFGPNVDQIEVFDEVGKPMLQRFINGESCVLFAYGMTNSGKTHTIQGNNGNPGLLPRIVDNVLEKIAQQASSTSHFELHISMLEIYQERVFDLLSKRRDKLTIRDGNGHVEVVKLSTTTIASSSEAVRLLEVAASNRSKSTTMLNSGSSRSHAVYTLTLRQLVRKQVADTYTFAASNYSVFHVVDLAGAERSNRTKANFLQLKEANNINVSLMQLWRCLQAMKKKNVDANNGLDLIPYRESKLTHLLMPELGRAGIAGVAMITCVNPQSDDYDETISILGNASIACKITELADIGRPATAAQTSMISSIFSHLNPAGISVADKASTALENPKQPQPQHSKRKRDKNSNEQDQPVSNTVPFSTKRLIVPTSQVSSVNLAKALRKNSSCAVPPHANSTRNTKSSISSNGSGNMRDCDEAVENDDKRELKRLRVHITKLEKENEELQRDQIQKESDLRCEIANEMSERTVILLEQIKRLKLQIKSHDGGSRSPDSTFRSSGESDEMSRSVLLQRSVRKAKRKQLDKVTEDLYEDLHQLQEEYEQMKSSYEKQIQVLHEEKEQLLLELQDWKSRAHSTTNILQQLQQEVARDLSPSSTNRAFESRSCADENEVMRRVSKKSSTGEKKSKKKSSNRENCSITRSKLSIRGDENKDTIPMDSTAETASLKRSPLGKYNQLSGQQQPLFPPKSNRPLSPARARSPLASNRGASPLAKAPYASKSITADENSSQMFGQVVGGVSAGMGADGSTYFKRLRSNFAVRG